MATGNVIWTPTVAAKFMLADLRSMLNVARNMSKALTPEFGKRDYKIGDTVTVKKPFRFVGGDGLTFDPEALVRQTFTVTVDQTPHVHFQWDSVEKTLDVEEAKEMYSRPASIAMASKINKLAATYAAQNAMHSVGTPGTAPTSESTYLAAGDILVEHGLPDGEDLTLIVNRRMSTAFVSGVKALFNPSGTIARQWNTGVIEPSLGYKIMRDQAINTHTVGAFSGTPLVNGAAQTAAGGNNATMTLVTDGWTSTSLKKGDKFTIGSATVATDVAGGVQSAHPQTRTGTGRQQVFTVTADISDTAGAISMVVQPAITISGQYQNVMAAPVDNAIITMIGTTGATAQQGLLMHKNAFAFVSVPMQSPEEGTGGVGSTVTDPETGLTIRYTRYWDGDESIHKIRYDALIGFGAMYKEMACVIQA